MTYLAGIDLGSTNLKAVIYDVEGSAIASASRPIELLHPDPGHPDWAVWDPKQIWNGIGAILGEAIATLENPRDIRGVAVTGMGMDGVPVDAAGNTLYPFISWHCPRTEPQYRDWLKKVGAEQQFAIGGNQIWVFNTAFRLQWMQENEPEILEKTDKWLLIEDFVNFKLCGEHATDYSMASTTLLFDQRQQKWSDELIELAGIDPGLLCDPHPSGTVLGTVHAEAAAFTGLPEGTPVVLGGHDYCCGALATGAFKPGVVLDVNGTWEVVVAAIPAPVLTPPVREMGIVVDSHVARDMWSVMGAAVAADALEWFRREYGSEEKTAAETSGVVDWELLIDRATASPPGANGVMFLPHMSGSHCPIVDPNSMGAFVGLRNITGKGDMLRAMIEGLTFQLLQMVNGFKSGLDIEPETIVAIGGATKNELWMQTKADVLDRPIQVPELDEAVPLGAAILAGIGCREYDSEQQAFERIFKPGRTYEPDATRHRQYAERFAIYEHLYPALQSFNKSLHDLNTLSQ